MYNHLHLFLVLAIALLVSGVRSYNDCSRDWCGLCLLPKLFLISLPSLSVITLIYVSLVDVVEVPVLRNYWLLVSAGAATFADYIAPRMLRSEGVGASGSDDRQPKTNPLLAKTLIRKRLALVELLVARSDCKQILENAMNACPEISTRTRLSLSKKLGNPPSREQIFAVIRATGLGTFAQLIPGGW
jgi:hypothetical protein